MDNKDPDRIDVEQTLLKTRNVYCFGIIEVVLTKRVCEDLLALDSLEPGKPIGLWINSYGGAIEHGFAIIDTILGLTSPVYTCICGTASSMGALISLAGDMRTITDHSTWMIHDISINPGDEYVTKIEPRIRHHKEQWATMKRYMKSRSKLTEDDFKQAKNGELWLSPNQCKKKEIVHVVTKFKKGKR